VKLVDISGTRKEYLKAKIDELETNSKNKNIGHLYRGVSLELIYEKMERMIWLGGGTISLSY
jgi:hypothetical protein